MFHLSSGQISLCALPDVVLQIWHKLFFLLAFPRNDRYQVYNIAGNINSSLCSSPLCRNVNSYEFCLMIFFSSFCCTVLVQKPEGHRPEPIVSPDESGDRVLARRIPQRRNGRQRLDEQPGQSPPRPRRPHPQDAQAGGGAPAFHRTGTHFYRVRGHDHRLPAARPPLLPAPSQPPQQPPHAPPSKVASRRRVQHDIDDAGRAPAPRPPPDQARREGRAGAQRETGSATCPCSVASNRRRKHADHAPSVAAPAAATDPPGGAFRIPSGSVSVAETQTRGQPRRTNFR